MRRLPHVTFGFALALGLAQWACGDSGRGAEAEPSDAGVADTGAMLDVGATIDASSPETGVPPSAQPAIPAYVELALEPQQSFYTRDDRPRLVATVYDRLGGVVDDSPLDINVRPATQGTLDADGVLMLLVEGQGAVSACSRSKPDLCGRVSFFVDDGPPTLEVTAPTRAAVLTGEARIEVRGTAVDTGDVEVRVNETPVDLAEDGSFSHQIPARFGLNRIDVVADDGVRRPPPRVVMEVVWAPARVEAAPDRVHVAGGLALRLDQALLDTGAVAEPDEAGNVLVHDLALTIETLLSFFEPMDLLDDPQLADGDPLALTVLDARAGTTDIDLQFTRDGVEFFLRIEGLEADLAGGLEFDGQPLGLDGTISIDAAAFANIGLGVDDAGRATATLRDAGVAVEALRGEMADPTAQALLDTFGSLLRVVVAGFADTLIDDLVRQTLPGFFSAALDETFRSLAHVAIEARDDEVLPPVVLDLYFTPAPPVAAPLDGLVLSLDAEIRQPQAHVPPHDDPGIATVGIDAPAPWPADAGLAVGGRLLVMNALLHELWRESALRIDATPKIPEQLRGLVAEVRVDARLPPMLVGQAPGSPEVFELQMGELDLFARGPTREEPDHYVLSVRAGVDLEVDPARLRFAIAEVPDIRVELLSTGGPVPVLPPDGVSTLIEQLVWPQIARGVRLTLDLPFEDLVLGPDVLGEIAPGLAAARIVPRFPEPPYARGGWFIVPAIYEAVLEPAR